ncbi:hypothetical protein [Algivirga pacifica]|uniref:Outer membrane lipoprotein-sorting protein n=1 Tax=Algivirga pacifica TaxID=1162670 RepID=A0ABP9DGH3_9BACT
MYKYLFILVIVSPCIGNVWGQSKGLKMLQKSMEAYGKLSDFDLRTNTVVYGGGSSMPVMSTRTHSIKKDSLFYQDNGFSKIVRTKRKLLILNEEEKSISVQPASFLNSKEQAIEKDLFDQQLLNADIRYLGEQEGMYYLQLKASSEAYEMAEIYLEKNTSLLKKIIYHYNEEDFNGVSKVMMKIDISPVSESMELLTERYYLVRDGKEIKPSSRFKHFTILQPTLF